MREFVNIVGLILDIYSFILLLRALMSWIPMDRDNPIARVLYAVTEPVLEPIRSILPSTGPVDFSVFVAFLIILALRQVMGILLN